MLTETQERDPSAQPPLSDVRTMITCQHDGFSHSVYVQRWGTATQEQTDKAMGAARRAASQAVAAMKLMNTTDIGEALSKIASADPGLLQEYAQLADRLQRGE